MFAPSRVLVFSSLVAIAFATPSCSQGTCKDEQVSLLQTLTNVKRHDEAVESDENQDEEHESDEELSQATGDGWGWRRRRRRRRTPPPAPPPPPTQPPADKFADIKEMEKEWSSAIKLTLKLRGGSGLKDTDGFGRGASDPYCKIKLKCDGCLGTKDYTEKQTSVVDNNHNPTWNFLFKTNDYNTGDRVEFNCYDKDIYSSEFIGKGELVLTRGVYFSGTVTLNTQGYLDVEASWQHCSGDCEDKLITMAKLADYVYTFGEQADNWHLIQKADVNSASSKKDHLALYKKKGSKECALAFSGSNDLGDWVQNFNALWKSNVCGYSKVHAGMVSEVTNYFRHSAMVPISEIIRDMCGGEAFIVGHSLGGGVASITAGCLNSAGGAKHIPEVNKGVIPFKAKGLYTVAAPASSMPAMTSTGGACFEGRRDFIYDSMTFDVVPYVAGKFGYLHPEVEALELHTNSNEVVSKKTWPCTSMQAERYPYGLAVKAPSLEDHKTSTYIKRLKALFR